MPRQLRMEHPGAMYHVMNRGDRREDISRDHEDRQRFLATLGEACQKTEWQVPAYCLPEELRRLGWADEDLPGRRKGDTSKVAIARRLRQETTTCLPAGR